MPKVYKLTTVLAFLIIFALASGCSHKKAEPPPMMEESIIEEDATEVKVEVDVQATPDDTPAVVEQPPETRETIIEKKAVEEHVELDIQTAPADTVSEVEQPVEVKEEIVEEEALEESVEPESQPVPDDMPPPAVSTPPQDMDGVTPESTSLSLPLNGTSRGNSLDYDANDKADWWRIMVPAIGVLKISGEPSPGLSIALYGGDGVTQIYEPADKADRGQVSAELPAAGTYYIKVYVDQPGSSLSYTLNISYTDMNFLLGFKSYDEGNYED